MFYDGFATVKEMSAYDTDCTPEQIEYTVEFLARHALGLTGPEWGKHSRVLLSAASTIRHLNKKAISDEKR